MPPDENIPLAPTGPGLENTTDLGDSHPSVPVEEPEADGDDLKGLGYHNF